MSFEISLQHRIGDCELSVDFVRNARITAITGPSGIGKTTLLHCVAGLIQPDRARIVVGDELLFDTGKDISVPMERRKAGYVFQDARLFPHLTVAGNISYGAARADAASMIDERAVLEVLGIDALMGRWPATLSGGEVRRVAIARALLSGPSFLLMDEPLASLDRPRAKEILGMIHRLVGQIDIPILYVSHQQEEANWLGADVVSLD